MSNKSTAASTPVSEDYLAGYSLGTEFKKRHPEYIECDRNAELLIDWFVVGKKPFTVENLEVAYESIKPLLKLRRKIKSAIPDVGWKWLKWTFGFWSDPANNTLFGIDIGPLEIVWRFEGYRP